MALSAIDLCSQGLLKIGSEGIESFKDNTAEAHIAATIYPGVRDALLSVYPWHFATRQQVLVRLTRQPIADFEHAFALPTDFLRALSAGTYGMGYGIEYRISAQQLHSNSPNMILTYIFQPDESAFPPFFNHLLTTRLAAEFCIPLTESTSRSEMLHKLAEKALQQAKTIDMQQDTPERIREFTLIGVRN